MTLLPLELTTNHEGAATSTGFVDGKGEPDNRRGDRFVQGSFALWVVEDVVEEEERRVVAGVHDRTDLNCQANGGRAAFHRDVSVLYVGKTYKASAVKSLSMKFKFQW